MRLSETNKASARLIVPALIAALMAGSCAVENRKPAAASKDSAPAAQAPAAEEAPAEVAVAPDRVKEPEKFFQFALGKSGLKMEDLKRPVDCKNGPMGMMMGRAPGLAQDAKPMEVESRPGCSAEAERMRHLAFMTLPLKEVEPEPAKPAAPSK